jgi:hypothetical protein
MGFQVQKVMGMLWCRGCSAKESGREPQPSLKKKVFLDEQSLKPRRNNLGRVLFTVQENQQSKLLNNLAFISGKCTKFYNTHTSASQVFGTAHSGFFILAAMPYGSVSRKCY